MILFQWLSIHWPDAVSMFGTVGGLIFSGWAMRDNAQAQRAANLLQLTKAHRDIWKMAIVNPKLCRVLELQPDLVKYPVTPDEARFVGFLFLHLNASYREVKVGILIKAEGLGTDIVEFLGLPIPQAVWKKNRHYYDREFVKFVESAKSTSNLDSFSE